MSETIDGLIDRLIAGHDGGPLVDSVPESLVPADLASTYAMQDKMIARLGPIGGWKVMAGGQGEPLCAPIPASRYFDDGATVRAAHHNLVLTEIEIAVWLGHALAADADAATVDAAIAAVLPAIEMVGSPFVDRNQIAFNAKLADLQSNGAVVVGKDFDPRIRDQLPKLGVTLELDGQNVATADKGASYQDIVEAVRWLSGHAAARGIPLQAGQVIITGSRILHAQGKARSVVARMADWGSVTTILEG